MCSNKQFSCPFGRILISVRKVPKVTKIEEFYPSRASRREPRGRTIKIKIKDGAQRSHYFRHFRSFLILAHLLFYRFKTLQSGVKCTLEMGSIKIRITVYRNSQ